MELVHNLYCMLDEPACRRLVCVTNFNLCNLWQKAFEWKVQKTEMQNI